MLLLRAQALCQWSLLGCLIRIQGPAHSAHQRRHIGAAQPYLAACCATFTAPAHDWHKRTCIACSCTAAALTAAALPKGQMPIAHEASRLWGLRNMTCGWTRRNSDIGTHNHRNIQLVTLAGCPPTKCNVFVLAPVNNSMRPSYTNSLVLERRAATSHASTDTSACSLSVWTPQQQSNKHAGHAERTGYARHTTHLRCAC